MASSLVLLGFVAFTCFVWVRSTRRKRLRWERRLNLPGVWVSQDEQSETIEFTGGHGEGHFVRGASRGAWHLSGQLLVLEPDAGEQQRLSLTYYGPGKIGLEPKPGHRRYFQKSAGNVVPLHRRA